MNRKETERRIKKSFENAAPDRLDDIKKRLNKATDADGIVPMHMGKKRRLRDRSIIYTGVLAAVAAVLLIVNGIMIIEQGNRTKKEEMTVARTLTLDLENSVALDVNAVGQVVTVKTLDKDTADIINSLDLTGTPSDVAVNAIVGAMYQKGCLGGDVTDIVVTETAADATEPENSEAVSVSADDAGQSEETASDNSPDMAAASENASDAADEKQETVSVSVDSAAIAALADDNEDGRKAATAIALADAGIKAEKANVTKAGIYTLKELIFGTELTMENSSDKTGDKEAANGEKAETKSDEKSDGNSDDKSEAKSEEKAEDKAENKKSDGKENEEAVKADDTAADTESGNSADGNTDKKTSDSAGDEDKSAADGDESKDSASDNSADKKESSDTGVKKTFLCPILTGIGDADKKVWFVEFIANGYTYSSIIDLEGNVIYYSRKNR